MAYRVTLYSPDRGLVYDGRTLDARGVGGGITARLALLEALAREGHQVTACVNAPAPSELRGVRYVPLDQVDAIDTDVLIAMSTGGALSFEPLRALPVQARLRMLWVQGVPKPDALDAVEADVVCVASNFLRDVVTERWGLPAERVLVIYNGLRTELFSADGPERDPFAVAYVGPPEKGLDAAYRVVESLRAHDTRYRLEVFGGAALWGDDDSRSEARPGEIVHGLLGQREFVSRLARCEYALALQAIEEGFGIGVQEARRAGAIVLASPAGALPELLRDGYDGFVMPGDYASPAVTSESARLILELACDPERRARLRGRAMAVPWDWQVAARSWSAFMDHALGTSPAPPVAVPGRARVVALPDGRHDLETGAFCPAGYPASPMLERFGQTDRVLIGGYYGHGNLGDEAILQSMLDALRAHRPNLSATVVSGDPDDTRRRHHVAAVHDRDVAALMDAAEASDLIVLGGGGLFHDYQGADEATTLTRWHWGLTFCEAFPILAEVFGKPFQVYAAGVGPLRSDDGRAHTRRIFDRADAATVRDQASLDLLRTIGARTDHVEVAGDPAFLLSSAPADARTPDNVRPATRDSVVTVAVREWTEDDAGDWPVALAAALDQLIDATGVTVVFLPFQMPRSDADSDDAVVARRIRALMARQDSTVVTDVPFSPAETQGVLAASGLVVSVRLHGVILAGAAGVPVVGLGYDPKVTAAMETLGLGAFVVPLAGLDSRALGDRLEQAWRERDARRAGLLARLPGLRASAGRSAQLSAELLSTRPYQPRPASPDLATQVTAALRRNTVRADIADHRVQTLERDLTARDRRIAELVEALTAANTAAILGSAASADPAAVAAASAPVPSDSASGPPDQPVVAGAAALATSNREVWRLIRELAARPPAARAAATSPTATRTSPEADSELDARVAAAEAALRERDAELAVIHRSKAWRAVTAYRDTRRSLSRAVRHPIGAIGRAGKRAVKAVLPPPARTRLRQAAARRMQTPYSFVFDRYRRARAALAGPDLSAIRAPGRPGLVSVVLPAYNGGTMIEGAIESVLAQTHADLELIVVNDGSTDATARIAEDFARRDPRVRVIHQENQKLPAALSRGFREARGEFLTWTSCDNRLKPDFVERMAACLRRHPDWDMAYANLDLIGEDGEALTDSSYYEAYQQPHRSPHIALPDDTSELNVWANNYVGAAFMYRSRVATLLGDYSRHRFVSEDYDYWMRVNALMVLRKADFDEPVYEYRFHGTSLTSRWAELRMLEHRDRLMVFEDFRRDFNLTPMLWLIEGDAPEARAIREAIEAAGQIVVRDAARLADLPPLWVPLVRLTVTADPAATRPPERRQPDSALHVLCATTGDLPSAVDDGWDLCAAIADVTDPPALSPSLRGWLTAASPAALCHAVDVFARSRHLAAIESLVEAPPTPKLDASVIVCTHRAGERVTRAMESALTQSHAADRYEVIVVDNNPADGAIAAEVARLRDAHRASRPDGLRYVACPIRGLSAARNAGLAAARGEVVCFIDDDAVAAPDWLSTIVSAFASRPDAGVIGGHIELQVPEPRPLAVRPGWEKYWSHFVTGFPALTEVRYWWEFPWGANWCARRAALLQAGGFRSQYGRTGDNFWGGEELVAAATVRKLGWTIAVEPAARVLHDVDPARFTFAHVLRTLVAGHQVTYLAQRDLYLPMESSLGRTVREVLTRHRDADLPPGRGRWRNIAYRKLAQLRLLAAQARDVRLRLRPPLVAPPRGRGSAS